jgi:hypothetical protein
MQPLVLYDGKSTQSPWSPADTATSHDFDRKSGPIETQPFGVSGQGWCCEKKRASTLRDQTNRAHSRSGSIIESAPKWSPDKCDEVVRIRVHTRHLSRRGAVTVLCVNRMSLGRRMRPDSENESQALRRSAQTRQSTDFVRKGGRKSDRSEREGRGKRRRVAALTSSSSRTLTLSLLHVPRVWTGDTAKSPKAVPRTHPTCTELPTSSIHKCTLRK